MLDRPNTTNQPTSDWVHKDLPPIFAQKMEEHQRMKNQLNTPKYEKAQKPSLENSQGSIDSNEGSHFEDMTSTTRR